MHKLLLPCVVLLSAAGCVTPVEYPHSTPIAIAPVVAPQPPRATDRFVYSVRNGYNGEPVGQLEYRVDKVDRDRMIMAVNPAAAYPNPPVTEVVALDGNWLRHALINHNQLIEYDFAQPFPAYAFPLEPRRTWSQRVNARNAATGRTVSVRVDGEVLGGERIVTPAGSFDTIRIQRRIYAGDWDGFLSETTITESEWYSPEFGRPVRLDRSSQWMDTSRGAGGMIFNNNQLMHGDWLVAELATWPGMGSRPAAALPDGPAAVR
jgi:hypothetical protein